MMGMSFNEKFVSVILAYQTRQYLLQFEDFKNLIIHHDVMKSCKETVHEHEPESATIVQWFAI